MYLCPEKTILRGFRLHIVDIVNLSVLLIFLAGNAGNSKCCLRGKPLSVSVRRRWGKGHGRCSSIGSCGNCLRRRIDPSPYPGLLGKSSLPAWISRCWRGGLYPLLIKSIFFVSGRSGHWTRYLGRLRCLGPEYVARWRVTPSRIYLSWDSGWDW